jgi:hypothetical protein
MIAAAVAVVRLLVPALGSSARALVAANRKARAKTTQYRIRGRRMISRPPHERPR